MYPYDAFESIKASISVAFKAQNSYDLKRFFSNTTWCVSVHLSPVIPNCKAYPWKKVLQIWLMEIVIWKFKHALTSGEKVVLLENDWNLGSSKNSGYLELWHQPAASSFHKYFPKAKVFSLISNRVVTSSISLFNCSSHHCSTSMKQ